MDENKVEERESVESVVANLRDEFISSTPKPEKLEAPKIGKALPTPKSRMRLLNMLTIIVILAGITTAVSMLMLRSEENTAVSDTNNPQLENAPEVEEILSDIEPTMPITTARPPQTAEIPLPDDVAEEPPLPTAEPYTLPEEPLLSTTPITEP